MAQKDKAQLKKDLFWNTLGSFVYAAGNAVLAFLVMRIAGEEDGGIFGFGFSTFGQQMFIIAYFGIRPFHITDVRREYGFSVYRRARILTSLLAVAAALLYLGVLSLSGMYTPRKALIIFLLALYKIADGYADVYESECQRDGFLWRGGRELCFRTVLVSAVFLTALAKTGNLITAALPAVVCQAAAILFFRSRLLRDPSASAQMDTVSDGTVKELLGSTLLLFFSVFLDFYVFSGVKYAIDAKLGDAASGVFNILFMPTSVIYLAANFVIKPYMTLMAERLENKDQVGFIKMRRRIALIILGLTAAGLLCVILLGGWALGVFEWILGDAYQGSLTGHTGDLFLIILGGGLYALANLYYYVLVIKRRQKAIFLVYLSAAAVTLFAAPWIVGSFGITGASAGYAALMSLLLFGMKLCDLLS